MAKFPNATSIPASSLRPRGNAYFRCKTNLVNLDPLRFACTKQAHAQVAGLVLI